MARLWRHPCKPPNRIKIPVDAETEDEAAQRLFVDLSSDNDLVRRTITLPGAGVTDYSSRARTTVSGKCFGLITLLLKFSEKIGEPGGQGSLKGVLCTEALPDSVLNIAR
jgi:hypothetical protein